MLNKELFLYDPTQRSIPNDGVAKIGAPEDDRQWQTLRFELEHFVCEGQYEAGLDRILDGYLMHMDQPEQPAVWVSGFYGSGKSHFLRVLESLWNDPDFPDGASARGITQVSQRVATHLKELDTLGKRSGGLWAAAGTLGAGAAGSVRLAFMGILFAAAGLPTNYAAAKLVLWLKQESAEEQVRALLAEQGRTLEKELRNMYVSPHLGEALIAAIPGFATSAAQALEQLITMYPPQLEDIDNDELCDTMRDLLLHVAESNGKSGQLPCTLIVMDELQQYLGDDVDRADKVLRIVEAVTSKFGSQVLFVASGQSAMGSTPGLLRLQDRFTGRVEFTDTDVDRVVRRVILQKAPDRASLLEGRLTELSGEINRHLQGTRLASIPEDAQTLVPDYPLLPTRRRFWENVLRAIDRGGSAAQLRTQLRSVQEATKFVAEMAVGVAVPGDFIYEQQVNGMLHSGVLSKDIHEKIEGLRDGSVDGGLKFRLAALCFLIGQLKEVNRDLGVRANASTLADLLIANLNDSSAMLRTEVEKGLAELADEGVLQSVDGEYTLQGRIGTEWQQDYQQRVNRIKDETARIAAVRSAKLQDALQAHVGSLAFTQGDARVPRKGQYVYGTESPDLSTGRIPVWVRDEWSVGSLKAAQDEAASRGSEDPVVHILIPKRDPQAIKDEIVKLEAAQEVLNARTAGGTEEGAAAKAGIQARHDAAEEQLRKLMSELMTGARVFISGGNEMREADLKASVEAGLRAAAQRMFFKFAVAEGKWGQVVQRAAQGSGTALEALGYQGEPASHPVCAEVLRFVGGAGKKGSEIRDHFKASPYGWPQDAIDGALMVLARAEVMRVTLNGAPALPSQVTQDRLGTFAFAPEHGPVLTAEQKLELRKLFVDAGMACPSGQEAETLASFLTELNTIGQRAGGAAPRPSLPDLQPVRDVQALSGNERLSAAWEARVELGALWRTWNHAASEIEQRMPRWDKLETLLQKAASLAVVTEARLQRDAVLAGRLLLEEPDPISPLVTSLVDALRTAIREQLDLYKSAREEGLAELQAVPEYAALPPETWRSIVARHGLGPLPDIDLSTEYEVLAELDQRPLPMWQDLIAGMRGRIDAARADLAKAVEPETVPYAPPLRRLTSAGEVDEYIAEIRSGLMAAIEAGHPVIITRQAR